MVGNSEGLLKTGFRFSAPRLLRPSQSRWLWRGSICLLPPSRLPPPQLPSETIQLRLPEPVSVGLGDCQGFGEHALTLVVLPVLHIGLGQHAHEIGPCNLDTGGVPDAQALVELRDGLLHLALLKQRPATQTRPR